MHNLSLTATEYIRVLKDYQKTGTFDLGADKLTVRGVFIVPANCKTLPPIPTTFYRVELRPYASLRLFNHTADNVTAYGNKSLQQFGPQTKVNCVRGALYGLTHLAGTFDEIFLLDCQKLQAIDPDLEVKEELCILATKLGLLAGVKKTPLCLALLKPELATECPDVSKVEFSGESALQLQQLSRLLGDLPKAVPYYPQIRAATHVLDKVETELPALYRTLTAKLQELAKLYIQESAKAHGHPQINW